MNKLHEHSLLPRRLTVALVLLSTAYLVAGIHWALGGSAFPFGVAKDPLARHQSLLENLSQQTGSWWVVGAGALGVTVAVLMTWSTRNRLLTGLLAGAGTLQFLAYTLVIPDGRPLIATAHIPILLAGKPFGWPPGVTISSQVSWPVLNQAILMTLGTLWAAATLRYSRSQRHACTRCGRSAARETWTSPARAAVWGRWAVAVAVTVPVFYALTRLAWFAGVPLGTSQSFLDEESTDSPSIFLAGAFMATLALGGAVLTLGLVQRWGEVYPRWIPHLRGREVRPRTALVPATAVSFMITGPGLAWLRPALNGWFPEGSGWSVYVPAALMPAWGLALAAAAYAYYLRRRGVCHACGRGRAIAVGHSRSPGVSLSRRQR